MKSLYRYALGALALTTVGVAAYSQQSSIESRTSAAPGRPGAITIEGPTGALAAPRDTLTYTLRWGRATNATSYKITVTAASTPTGTTLGLPSAITVPDTFATFSASNLTYDSLAFNASVTAARGTRVNSTASTKTWNVVKLPGVPGSIQVDSTAVPPPMASLDISLIPASLVIGQTGKACAYLVFSNNKVAMRTQDTANCQTDFIGRYTSTRRAITAPTQAFADNSCVVWTSSNTAIATVSGSDCILAKVGSFVRVASLY
jgi:hypothetical protein